MLLNRYPAGPVQGGLLAAPPFCAPGCLKQPASLPCTLSWTSAPHRVRSLRLPWWSGQVAHAAVCPKSGHSSTAHPCSSSISWSGWSSQLAAGGSSMQEPRSPAPASSMMAAWLPALIFGSNHSHSVTWRQAGWPWFQKSDLSAACTASRPQHEPLQVQQSSTSLDIVA